MTRSGDEFYVGYLERAPEGLTRWLRPRVIALLLLAPALAATLAASQGRFAPSVFEGGPPRTFEGTLLERPVPQLVLPRPGGVGGAHFLLTVFGKRGAESVVAGRDGRLARVTGHLIHRDGTTMLEVAEEGVQLLGPAPSPEAPVADGQPDVTRDLGEHVFVGEIVDSKCFLGVMKPGHAGSHRACAVRCLSGGVPPLLLVRDAAGAFHRLLLVDLDGASVNDRILDLVAVPVRVRGRLLAEGDLLVLRSDPATIEPVDAGEPP